jgi:hypothetical protein
MQRWQYTVSWIKGSSSGISSTGYLLSPIVIQVGTATGNTDVVTELMCPHSVSTQRWTETSTKSSYRKKCTRGNNEGGWGHHMEAGTQSQWPGWTPWARTRSRGHPLEAPGLEVAWTSRESLLWVVLYNGKVSSAVFYPQRAWFVQEISSLTQSSTQVILYN